MQHPVAFDRLPNGQFEVLSFWQLLMNPWALLQYAHNMTGAVVTGSFVMAAVGAFYLLEKRREAVWAHLSEGGRDCRCDCIHRASSFQLAICTASTWLATSRRRLRRWKGCSRLESGAGMVLIGQPNEETGEIDNPIVVNDMLSFLIYGTTKAEVKGLDQIPHDQWPTALPLLYYAYHIMAGLGTWFVAADGCGCASAVARAALHRALGCCGRCC
jgi:cytochrome d ubiquinol oxidase subunit I